MIDNVSSAERAIEFERRLWSDLVTRDDGTPAVWEDLVRRSAPLTPQVFFYPKWSANSAFTPSSSPGYHRLPGDLACEWAAYNDRWRRFLELNPRALIAERLTDVSETHDATSFPYAWEHVIHDWVRSGFPEPRPFDDRARADSPDWRREFAGAAAAAGDGWVHYADDRYLWRDIGPEASDS